MWENNRLKLLLVYDKKKLPTNRSSCPLVPMAIVLCPEVVFPVWEISWSPWEKNARLKENIYNRHAFPFSCSSLVLTAAVLTERFFSVINLCMYWSKKDEVAQSFFLLSVVWCRFHAGIYSACFYVSLETTTGVMKRRQTFSTSKYSIHWTERHCVESLAHFLPDKKASWITRSSDWCFPNSICRPESYHRRVAGGGWGSGDPV